MKKTIITALVAIVGIAFIGAPVTVKAQTSTNAMAPAAPSTAEKKDDKKKPSGEYTPYKGKLTAIDATSATVTTKKGDVKLAIDDKTEFKVDQKKATAADFAAGDDVTGSYKAGADGSLTAHSIHKKTPKK